MYTNKNLINIKNNRIINKLKISANLYINMKIFNKLT